MRLDNNLELYSKKQLPIKEIIVHFILKIIQQLNDSILNILYYLKQKLLYKTNTC